MMILIILKHILDEDLSLITKQFKQIIAKILNQYGNNYGLIEYIKAVLYYIVDLGNFKDPDKFLKELSADPVIGGQIMGTLASKFEEQGLQKGKLEQAIFMAVNMLKDNASYNDIVKYTGLTIEQIVNLDVEKTYID